MFRKLINRFHQTLLSHMAMLFHHGSLMPDRMFGILSKVMALLAKAFLFLHLFYCERTLVMAAVGATIVGIAAEKRQFHDDYLAFSRVKYIR